MKCPHIIIKQAGDEEYSICELNTKPCLLEAGYECETWNDVQNSSELFNVAILPEVSTSQQGWHLILAGS